MLQYKHTTKEDIPKIDEWVQQDPDHKDKCTGSFFVLQPDEKGAIPKGMQCIEVRDDQGVVFYLKFTNALIVDTQFAPEIEVSKERVRDALKEAFVMFSASSKNLGYHAMLFESTSASLIAFFNKFKFRPLLNFFKVDL